MNTRLRPLVVLLALPLAGLAQPADSAAAPLPERPAALFTTYRGQRQRVVGFEGAVPLVVVAGARIQAHDAPVSIGIDSAFGAGTVAIERHPDASVVMDFFSAYGALGMSDDARLSASLTPDRDMPDAFIALLAYEKADKGQLAMPRLAVVGMALGDLHAGQPAEVNARPPRISSEHPVLWTALVFSQGRLVHTSDGNRALDQLFDEIDRAGWKAAVAQRASGTYPPKVYRGFPVRFGDATLKRHAGQSVRVRVVVTPAGLFDHAEVEGEPDLLLGDELSSQLANWLFLPKVADGQAQQAMMVMPFKF